MPWYYPIYARYLSQQQEKDIYSAPLATPMTFSWQPNIIMIYVLWLACYLIFVHALARRYTIATVCIYIGNELSNMLLFCHGGIIVASSQSPVLKFYFSLQIASENCVSSWSQCYFNCITIGHRNCDKFENQIWINTLDQPVPKAVVGNNNLFTKIKMQD